MFYDRFMGLCKKVGKSSAAVCRELGLNNSSATAWKRGSIPKSETLQKLATYFGVSVDYLLGYDLAEITPDGFPLFTPPNDISEVLKRNEVSDNILLLRKIANMTPDELAGRTGLSVQKIKDYESENSGRYPTEDEILSLAKVFKLTTEHIRGITPTEERLVETHRRNYYQQIIDIVDKLNFDGLTAAITRVQELTEIPRYCRSSSDLPASKPEPKIIPLYWSAAAAGATSPILGDDYDYHELTPEDPPEAMFAVRVRGDSMEPHFPDGSIAFCNKNPMADGDIGVFCLDGESFIKQYHYDRMTGITYLFSLNRQRADADKIIYPASGQMLTCMGRVITRQRYPLPQ